MRRFGIGVLSVLFLVGWALPAGAATQTWKFWNGTTTRSKIEIKLYSQNRDFVWPSRTTVWPLTNQNPMTLTIQCSPGEKICYGGMAPGTTSTWGAGANGKANCTACCYICDGATITKNLTGTPRPRALGR